MRPFFPRPDNRAAAAPRKRNATIFPDAEPPRPYLPFAACLGAAVLLTVIGEHIERSAPQYSSAGTPPVKAKPTAGRPTPIGELRRPASRPPPSAACGNMPQPGCISHD